MTDDELDAIEVAARMGRFIPGHDLCALVAEVRKLRDEARARVAELESACSRLTTENLRLDAERTKLARELITAAQNERSRLATVDHQRDLANRWLDIARAALPPIFPTVGGYPSSGRHASTLNPPPSGPAPGGKR